MEKQNALKNGGAYEICVIKGDVKNREFEFDILTRKPALPTMKYHYKIQPNIKQQILSEFYRFLNE